MAHPFLLNANEVDLAMVLLLPWAGSHALESRPSDASSTPAAQTAQMPENDRLAEPVLPESPTQVDIGRNLYYFHFMPCHGDRGQGLTDEWREVWKIVRTAGGAGVIPGEWSLMPFTFPAPYRR